MAAAADSNARGLRLVRPAPGLAVDAALRPYVHGERRTRPRTGYCTCRWAVARDTLAADGCTSDLCDDPSGVAARRSRISPEAAAGLDREPRFFAAIEAVPEVLRRRRRSRGRPGGTVAESAGGFEALCSLCRFARDDRIDEPDPLNPRRKGGARRRGRRASRRPRAGCSGGAAVSLKRSRAESGSQAPNLRRPAGVGLPGTELAVDPVSADRRESAPGHRTCS